MHLLWTALIGFVAGLIARAIKPGNDSAGFIVTTALGIAGAFIATYLGRFLHWYEEGQSAGFIGAIVGAVILLAVYHFITRLSAKP